MANTARITQTVVEALTSQTGTARITQSVVETLVGLGIQCGSPPSGRIGVAYTHTLLVGGGDPPYTFALVSGILPNGLGLNVSTGVISGTPFLGGTFVFTVQVSDSLSATASVTCSITIAGGFFAILLYGWKLFPVAACGDPVPVLEVPAAGCLPWAPAVPAKTAAEASDAVSGGAPGEAVPVPEPPPVKRAV